MGREQKFQACHEEFDLFIVRTYLHVASTQELNNRGDLN